MKKNKNKTKKLNLNDKAQESMPIQLLLGVTILTFVLTIGIYSYRQVCATQYDQKVSSGLNELGSAIEQAYRGGVGTTPPSITIDTSVPAGCDVGFESIRIMDGPSDACRSNLGKEQCVMAVAVSLDDRGNRYISSRVFIDIGDTNIDMEGVDDNCREMDLEEAYEDPFDDEEFCGWQTGTFSVQVTKEDEDSIKIKHLG